MTPATVALGIVALAVIAAVVLGVVGARGRLKTPLEYMVGGRSFGSLLLWLLMAGEIYTSFTFLGAAGYAYGLGAPSFYILCYGPVAYAIAFFLTPKIRGVGAKYGMLTGPDFFRIRYRSVALAALATFVGFVSLVPYVTLQLTGLQVLLSIAGFGAFDTKGAVVIALLLITAFVFVTGLRGTAWASILKDALVLIAVVFAGIALPHRFGGGWEGTLRAVEHAHPGWLTLAPGMAPHGVEWFVGAVVVSAPACVQRERVLAREGMTPAKFDALLAAQMPDGDKRARADFVIDTGGGIEDARRQVRAVLSSLRAAAEPAH